MVAVNGRRIAVGPAVSHIRWPRCICGHARNRTQLLADQARPWCGVASPAIQFSTVMDAAVSVYLQRHDNSLLSIQDVERVLQVVGVWKGSHEKPVVEAKTAY